MKRLGLTITRSYERITLKPEFDFSVIEQEGPVLKPELLEAFSDFCSSWSAVRNYSSESIRRVNKVTGALTRGPNGNSVVTAHYDAYAVRQDQELKSNLETLAALTGNR